MRSFWRGIFAPEPSLLLEAPGGGAGGGAPQGGGGGGQAGGGQPGGGSRDFSPGGQPAGGRNTQGAAGGGEGGGRRGQRLAPDTLIETDDGRVISYKDYLDEERSNINRDFQGRYKKGYDALVAEAERLDKLRQQTERGGQQQPQDPFGDIQDDQIMDGRTAKALIKRLSEQGFGPIANMLKQQQATIAALQKQVSGAGSVVGQFQEDRASQSFQSALTKVLSGIEVKGYPGGRVDVNDPAIRDVAEDLRLSYQEDSWRAGEFEKMLSDRLNTLYQSFLKAQRDYANKAPERLREAFPLTRGAGNPQGQARYKYETPRQIVQRARDSGMWGGGSART